MFKHIRLDHIVLRARNAGLLCDFYRSILDADIERELELGLIQLRAGDILIDIVPVDSELGRGGGPPPGPGHNMDHFCLRVEPFDEQALRARLDRLGTQYGETTERYGADGYGPSIYVTDPEGNVMELKGVPVRGLEPQTG